MSTRFPFAAYAARIANPQDRDFFALMAMAYRAASPQEVFRIARGQRGGRLRLARAG